MCVRVVCLGAVGGADIVERVQQDHVPPLQASVAEAFRYPADVVLALRARERPRRIVC